MFEIYNKEEFTKLLNLRTQLLRKEIEAEMKYKEIQDLSWYKEILYEDLKKAREATEFIDEIIDNYGKGI